MDHTDFKPGFGSAVATDAPSTVGGSWWKVEDPKDRASAVCASGDHLRTMQSARAQRNLLHARLYGNDDILGFGPRDYNHYSGDTIGRTTRVTLNVVASAIDTVRAKISKNRPRPNFLTSGGNWKSQQKARKLDKFMKGVFYDTKFFEKAKLQKLDSCVFGTGALKIFKGQSGRLEVERAFVDELFVDDAEGRYGNPRQIFQRKLVMKETLIEEFPEYADEINSIVSPPETKQQNGFGDMVDVWESWHLKSSDKAKDGLHCICIKGCELFSEPWKFDFFPFVFLRFKPRLLGFWGQGAAEQLTGIQISLNRIVRSVDEQIRRKGKGRIYVPLGSKLSPAHFTNNIADVIFYTGGVPPHTDNSNAVSNEEIQQIENLYRKAFQEVGVSELSVAARKPAGLDAAVALREFSDIESERFAMQSQDWDQNALNFTEIAIALIADDGGKGYKVRLPNKRFVVEVDWADINLKRDDFVLQIFPTSSLPQLPAARYQKVNEMKADGYIDAATAKRLMEFPDLEAETDLGNAAIDDCDAVISYILDDEVPHLEQPEKYQNLDMLSTRATAAYLFAKHHDCPENRLDMLRQLIDRTVKMNLDAQAAAQQSAAAAQAAAMPPQAPGAAPAGGGGASVGGNINMTQNNPTAPTVPPLIS